MLENIGSALGDGLSLVVTFVPRLLLFLVILLIGWLIAKALRKAVNAILERVGFDRAVERGGVGRALAQSRYDASDLVAAVVYYAILLITLQLAFGAFGPNPISDLLASIVAFLPALAIAIVIVVIAAAIAAAVRDLISSAMGGLSYGKVLANIASIFIIALGVIAALSQIGIAVAVTLPVLIAVLATIAGILIVGVGGGLIGPMRQRWETILTKAEREAPRAKAEAQANAGQATRRPQGQGPATPPGRHRHTPHPNTRHPPSRHPPRRHPPRRHPPRRHRRSRHRPSRYPPPTLMTGTARTARTSTRTGNHRTRPHPQLRTSIESTATHVRAITVRSGQQDRQTAGQSLTTHQEELLDDHPG